MERPPRRHDPLRSRQQQCGSGDRGPHRRTSAPLADLGGIRRRVVPGVETQRYPHRRSTADDRKAAEISIELPAGFVGGAAQPGLHRGPLLSSDHAVRLPLGKTVSLPALRGPGRRRRDIRRRRGLSRAVSVPFWSLRVINDTADESLPREVRATFASEDGVGAAGGRPRRHLAPAGQCEGHLPVARERPGRLGPIGPIPAAAQFRLTLPPRIQ